MSHHYRSPESFKVNRCHARAIAWMVVLMAVMAGCSPARGTQTPASATQQAALITPNISLPAVPLSSTSMEEVALSPPVLEAAPPKTRKERPPRFGAAHHNTWSLSYWTFLAALLISGCRPSHPV
jgi:hypothetical protein